MNGKKRVLLTGGAGYIGAHTAVELIRLGYDTVLIDDFSKSDKTLLQGIETITGKKLNFFEGDCRDSQFLAELLNHNKFDSVSQSAPYESICDAVRQPLLY